MLYMEDEAIKLNGVVLPGLVKSVEVTETAAIDEQEVEGSASKPKQATGYEDAKVNIELILDDTETQTKYQRLAGLRALFRAAGQGVPQPIPIVCADTAAHGVDKVLFKKLTHKAENKKGQLPVSLELWEYVPQTITAVKQSGGSSSSSGGSRGASRATASSAAVSSGLTGEYQQYIHGKRGKSPAVDDAPKPPKAHQRIIKLPL